MIMDIGEAIASADVDAVKQLLADNEVDINDDALTDHIIDGAMDADPEKIGKLATILEVLLQAGMTADEIFESEILDNERYPLMQTYFRLRPGRIRAVLNEMAYNSFPVVERALSEFSISPKDADALFDAALRRKAPGSLLAKLLEKGANVNQVNAAIRWKHPAAVEFLVSHGADVNAKDKDGRTPLHTSVIMQDLSIAKYLLKHGADTTITDKEGFTPPRLAEEYEEEEFIDLFGLPKVQSITVDDVNLAIINKNAARLKELIPKIKFDINAATGSNKRTVLGTAVTVPEMLEIVLAIPGIDVDAPATPSNGYTALHYAVLTSKAAETVPILLDAGADPNAKALNGKMAFIGILGKPTNPLTFLMKKFIENGANISLKTTEGKTIHEYATETYASLSDSVDDYDEDGPDPTTQSAMTNVQGLIEYLGPPESEIQEDVAATGRVHDERIEKFLVNAQKIPGFDVRGHEDGNGDIHPVYTTTLPKGTLLFRGTRNTTQTKEDLLGISKGGDVYCLSPNYEVFFYPFPFVDETVGAYNSILVYVLNHDITVASFINPCPLARSDRNIEGMPITSCDMITDFGCGLEGRKYDPCFNSDFLETNPDVVGMIAIAGQDRKVFLRNAERSTGDIRKNLNKYISMYSDSHSVFPGIPEIILYPRIHRDLNDKTVYLTGTLEDYLLKNSKNLSFLPFHTISSRSTETITSFIEQITSPGGFNGYHARIDMTTGFYVVEEILGSEDGLLPSEEADRMAEAFPELRFTRAVLPGFTPSSGGRRRTRRRI